ncbi:hypothetical protein BO94DRAFT_351328 [Aspergillus sclerotioniger CBS 115572]|uniref:Uncharacterized protein n=1 Tax=Aspergillus sclerotioniger CBS 115572 TaxID=1450535 RepID=A0A317X6F4_9EURO|nr:hypothetical protein BO94DRAFT_351328 [Aspergillus sclerotioniger CBS 115572]PWY93751.1 hypothetical protein BO94DRAFT_351328 [Aspergillus sclerotioniger CBS 115572]
MYAGDPGATSSSHPPAKMPQCCEGKAAALRREASGAKSLRLRFLPLRGKTKSRPSPSTTRLGRCPRNLALPHLKPRVIPGCSGCGYLSKPLSPGQSLCCLFCII